MGEIWGVTAGRVPLSSSCGTRPAHAVRRTAALRLARPLLLCPPPRRRRLLLHARQALYHGRRPGARAQPPLFGARLQQPQRRRRFEVVEAAPRRDASRRGLLPFDAGPPACVRRWPPRSPHPLLPGLRLLELVSAAAEVARPAAL